MQERLKYSLDEENQRSKQNSASRQNLNVKTKTGFNVISNA